VRGVDRVVVATDDDRIRAMPKGFGAEVVMTSEACRNGTERCAEVAAAAARKSIWW
jgi:3-deoxy-manno-octulosonate cytidylyltransferase (CMP-KDO synthetase)